MEINKLIIEKQKELELFIEKIKLEDKTRDDYFDKIKELEDEIIYLEFITKKN